VYLVDEEDGVLGGEKPPALLGFVDYVPHVFHPAVDGRQGVEGAPALLRDNLGQGGLSRAGWPPEDQGRNGPCPDLAGQGPFGAHQVALANVIGKFAGAYAFGQRFVHELKIL